jgi:hypothetical protein
MTELRDRPWFQPVPLGTALLVGLVGCTATVQRDREGGPAAEGAGAGTAVGGSLGNPTGGSGGTGTGGSAVSSGGSSGTGTGGSASTSGSGGGTSTGGSSGIPPTPEECASSGPRLGSAPLRRLSSREYLNTLSDLFPTIEPELPVLPTEAPVDSFDNDAVALGPSDVHVSRWEEIAFRYTRDLTQDENALEAFLPCAAEVADGGSESECGAELIASFGTKTHRRPLTSEETERYQALFDAQLAAIDFAGAVQLTAMAMLQSPSFLYRVEPARTASTALAPLDGWELASRLSYFLWQRMPDQELFDAAEAGTLTDDAELERQIRRMLADPRARAATADFHRQWLFFDRILNEEHETRVPELFPDWSAGTQASAHQELLRFTERVMFDGEGTLSALFLSPETEVDPLLAQIYGVTGPTESGSWAQVTLPETERAGLLTRVGFLAAHAHGANGSPPLRGNYVMQRIFCQAVDPPPPDADTSLPDEPDGSQTNREIFEAKTSPPACGGCHAILNGFGYPFEHYDAIGAYRDEDNGKPVNALATLEGTDLTGEVNGALDLSRRITESTQAAQCAVSRWVRYARGRGIEADDECALQALYQRFQASGGNVIELMVAIATSPEFRHRPSE